jgi:hypothetical protein
MISRSELDSAKDRLRIPELCRILGLPGEPITRDGVKFSSPLRPDAHPSCSFYDGCRRMKDWSTGKDYDAVDFLGEALGLQNGEAIRKFLEIANGHPIAAEHSPVVRGPQKPAQSTKPDLSGLVCGQAEAWAQVARVRRIDVAAVKLAQQLGTLRFGKVCGHLSWVLLDASGLCAEGRRLDGKKYPQVSSAQVQLGERKAHTLRGSRKDWPVGIMPAPEFRKSAETIALVEGRSRLFGGSAFRFKAAQNRYFACCHSGKGTRVEGSTP